MIFLSIIYIMRQIIIYADMLMTPTSRKNIIFQLVLRHCSDSFASLTSVGVITLPTFPLGIWAQITPGPFHGRGRFIYRLLVSGNGERDRIRTCDPVIKSHLLYQLSYAPEL